MTIQEIRQMTARRDIKTWAKEFVEDNKDDWFEEGKAEGKAEGKYEIGRKLKAMGMRDEDIAKATGLELIKIKGL